MNQNVGSTPETLSDELFEEEWLIKLNTGGEYRLSKKQAWTIQEAIASGNRGIIMFKTFSIPMPYVAEFYRVKRFLKEERQITGKQTEQAWTEEDRQNAIKRMKEIREEFQKKMDEKNMGSFQGHEEREKREFGKSYR